MLDPPLGPTLIPTRRAMQIPHANDPHAMSHRQRAPLPKQVHAIEPPQDSKHHERRNLLLRLERRRLA